MAVRRIDTRAYEETRPPNARARVRAEANARTSGWYNPWVHLAFPSLFGLGAIATSFALVDRPSAVEWLTVPVVWVLSNLNEWRIHRYILHRPSWPLAELFWRHTPEHHVIFVCDDMAIRSPREFRLVLIPFYGIVAIFVTTLPVTALLWWLVTPNVALLWVATSMGYVVSYEWLHLAYHLPADVWLGRRRGIAFLRRHHATHHTPELMQRWNFNVTVPLADWILGTVWKETIPAERLTRAGSSGT